MTRLTQLVVEMITMTTRTPSTFPYGRLSVWENEASSRNLWIYQCSDLVMRACEYKGFLTPSQFFMVWKGLFSIIKSRIAMWTSPAKWVLCTVTNTIHEVRHMNRPLIKKRLKIHVSIDIRLQTVDRNELVKRRSTKCHRLAACLWRKVHLSKVLNKMWKRCVKPVVELE